MHGFKETSECIKRNFFTSEVMRIFIFEKEIKIRLTIRHGEYMMISYRKILVKINCSN
jgi:hypothetical protein